MRYLVTGATGFIGGEVARQLLVAGHEVVALVRDPSRAGALAERGLRLVQGDITAPETLPDAMRGVDGLFHLAAWYRVGARDRSRAYRVNVEGTRNVLVAMRDAGVLKGVYTSTLAVFSDTRGRVVDETYRHAGPHLSEYDRTKWQAHYEVALPMIAEGLPLVIVQPGLVYGPGDASTMGQALRDYLRRRMPAIPARSAYCWGHVEDTARAHLLAMERGRPGETYIIAGPVHRLTEVFDLAARITGIPASRLRPAPAVMRAASGIAGLLGRVVRLPETYAAETLRVAAGVTYLGSSDKARRELGFEPRSLAEGLRETLEFELRRPAPVSRSGRPQR